MRFPTVHLEGPLLGAEILESVAEGRAQGQKPPDFELPRGTRVGEEIARAWADARAYWQAFGRRMGRREATGRATAITREAWVLPLLEALGYRDLPYQRRADEVDGRTYAISHRAGPGGEAPPIHIVAANRSLDRRVAGRERLSPHALVQEYLNRTEFLWGVVTNGRQLRLLRTSGRTARPTHVEFDLDTLMAGELYADFGLFFRLAHRSRLPRGVADADKCWLEDYHLESVAQGGRIRDGLRASVEQALGDLGTGFLHAPGSGELRRALREGEAGDGLQAADLYRELLVIVYRLLFLFVAEDRGLISNHPAYQRHYSARRLRRLAEAHVSRARVHADVWAGLRITFRLLEDGDLGAALDLPPLDGDLFSSDATKHLNAATIANADLLDAVYRLALYRDPETHALRRVNYAALDVEELGSVYESLLEYRPVVAGEEFRLAPGAARKATGSYYTRPDLVAELVTTALEPVLDRRLTEAKTPLEKEKAILAMNVCDPATGSGHFLLAAARRLGHELARVRTGEEEPAPEAHREAVRDVIRHCIYGVDSNPLAVDLCRVALWIEGHHGGRPLTFLDHRIRCGNSLLGVFDLAVLEEGIPDGAYKAVTGDDKAVAARLKKENRQDRKAMAGGQMLLPVQQAQGSLGLQYQALDAMPEKTLPQRREKERVYRALRQDRDLYVTRRTACDLWTAAFFAPLTEETAPRVPRTRDVGAALDGSPPAREVVDSASRLARQHRFFHWPLEFADVFEAGGFDVVLSNPPWGRVKLQEKDFFAGRDEEIATAPNRAARRRLIRGLPEANPTLHQAYRQALRTAEDTAQFLRQSGRFPLTSRGDVNTYPVFAGLGRGMTHPRGRCGMVVPTGIATDATTRFFFRDLVESHELASLFDFENKNGLFPEVHRSYKFSLVTTRGRDEAEADPEGRVDFAFFLQEVTDLRDEARRFHLTGQDFARVNPNTRTCPVFRSRPDADLARKIYERVPVLVNEDTGDNPWGVRFATMFHMSNDSDLFRTRPDLEAAGYRLAGNWFLRGDDVYLPLYEAKMFWQYDHRLGTYAGVTDRKNTHLPRFSDQDHADPARLPLPWYWVPGAEVRERLGERRRGWLMGFRDIARTTDERTFILSALPPIGAGNKVPLMAPTEERAAALAFCACCDSRIVDYVVRLKVAGATLNFFYVKQFPILPPSAYAPQDLAFIVPRVLELTYTAWDLEPFANEVWADAAAHDGLRDAIAAGWQANAAATGGGHGEAPPPDWLSIQREFLRRWGLGAAAAAPEEVPAPREARRAVAEAPERYGPRLVSAPAPAPFPHPPFKWDPERRAVLQAELDAYYAHLYGLTTQELRYILDPEDVYGPDFPGETFRVLKKNEIKRYGEYRTQRLVLEAWARLGFGQ